MANLYEQVLPYVQKFLCSPHPYRKGAVCPFVPKAVQRDNIYFTYFESEQIDIDNVQQLKEFIGYCCDYYKNQICNDNEFGAVLVLFPEDFSIEDLLYIHYLSKRQCVQNSLMLGALWDKNQAESLHNQAYFPLRTPIPMLVIRDLTVSDLTFLDPKHYNIFMRISFLNQYIRDFHHNSRTKVIHPQVQKSIKIRNHYRLRLAVIYSFFVICLLSCIFYLTGVLLG